MIARSTAVPAVNRSVWKGFRPQNSTFNGKAWKTLEIKAFLAPPDNFSPAVLECLKENDPSDTPSRLAGLVRESEIAKDCNNTEYTETHNGICCPKVQRTDRS